MAMRALTVLATSILCASLLTPWYHPWCRSIEVLMAAAEAAPSTAAEASEPLSPALISLDASTAAEKEAANSPAAALNEEAEAPGRRRKTSQSGRRRIAHCTVMDTFASTSERCRRAAGRVVCRLEGCSGCRTGADLWKLKNILRNNLIKKYRLLRLVSRFSSHLMGHQNQISKNITIAIKIFCDLNPV